MYQLGIYKPTVLIIGFLLILNSSFSQSHLALSIGAGFPDNINMKLLVGNQVQVGLSVGYDAYFDYNEPNSDFGPVSFEVYYHFGKIKEKQNLIQQSPWYLMGGLGYWWIVDKGVIFYPRIGRTINLSKKVGINLDAGAFFPMGEELVDFFRDSAIWPSGNIGLFYRF